MELRGVLLSIVPLWGLLAHITNSPNFIRIDIVCRTIIPASIVLRAFHFRFIFPSSFIRTKAFQLTPQPPSQPSANHTFSSGHKRYNTKPKSCNKKYNTTNSLFFSTIAQQIFAVTFFWKNWNNHPFRACRRVLTGRQKTAGPIRNQPSAARSSGTLRHTE